MPVKHKFISTKADGADSSLVRPSAWNSEHDVVGQLVSLNSATPTVFLGIEEYSVANGLFQGFVSNMKANGTNWESGYDGLYNGMAGILHRYGASGHLSFVFVPNTGGVKQSIPATSLLNYEQMRISNGGVAIGPGGSSIALVLTGSKNWDPGALNQGQQATQEVTVPGAVVGDLVVVSHSAGIPAGAILHGSVTEADTVTVTLFNVGAGAALNLPDGILRVLVFRI